MSFLNALKDKALAAVKDYYAREPARVNAVVLSVLVAVGVPVVIGGVAVGPIVVAVLAILLGGEATRRKVTPV